VPTPFPSLLHPIGRGAAASVWRGEFRAAEPGAAGDGLPIAIKVLRLGDLEGESKARARQSLESEIRAQTRLHHPGVAMVLDHREVQPHDEVPDAVGPGDHIIVMELCSRGSLERQPPPASWAELRGLLLALLDAIAHAHARGVVHRDIKPANVLLAGPLDARPGVKLSDFGIAWAVDRDWRGQRGGGTPRYMAPEQFHGSWRHLGPWTDLYGLGCLAWELVTGEAPFTSAAPSELALAHQSADLPPLVPRLEVPEGLELWLGRLLAKHPGARFQRAADAAWALVALQGLANGQIAPLQPSSDHVALHATLYPSELPTMAPSLLHVARPTAVPASTASSTFLGEARSATGLDPVRRDTAPVHERPQLPAHWSRPAPLAAPLQLLGAGLSLYGLRTLPLVGRRHERDTLWAALHAVHRARQPRLVLLHGAAGNGKSRLAAWIAARAHEVGAADVLSAIHGPVGGLHDGLMAMVTQRLRCSGLSGATLDRWLSEHPDVGPDDAAALGDCLRGAASSEPDLRARNALLRRLLLRIAATRPVVLLLDDVQWGSDALRFASSLLSAAQEPGAEELPVLVLATMRDEALPARPVEAVLIEQLMSQPGATRLPVAGLPPADHRLLVRELLLLEGDVAARVEERTRGNPLFAVQLVGDWVQRGVLAPGRTGFRPIAGADLLLPDDLHGVWRDRLTLLLAGCPPGDRSALEIAAALGQDVDQGEWERACDAAGLHPSPALLPLMQEERLALATNTGWAFVHGMLRESLERGAREAGRWEAHNQACADMLRAPGASTQPERLGRHSLQAGALREALQPLLEGATRRLADADPGGAELLLQERAQALVELGAPLDSRASLEGQLLSASVALHRGDPSEAGRLARRVEAAASSAGWTDLLFQAHCRLGDAHSRRTDLAEAQRSFTAALELAHATADDQQIADTHIQLAHVAILRGHHDIARTHLEPAAAIYTALQHPVGQAQASRFEGDIFRLQARWTDGATCYRKAIDLHNAGNNPAGRNNCLHGLAEVTRLGGDPDKAEPIYREVIRLGDLLGEDPTVPMLNLVLCQLQRGHHREAGPTLRRVAERSLVRQQKGLRALVRSMELAVQADAKDWHKFRLALDEAADLLERTGMIDPDLGWTLDLGARLARDADQEALASQAARLAQRQWAALGRDDAAG
jgi:eukaryotic-like serine/threonine-protein kinase